MKYVYLWSGAAAVAVAAFAAGFFYSQYSIKLPASVFGQVVSHDDSSVTVQLQTGGQKTFAVSPQTVFLLQAPAVAKKLSDVIPGMQISLVADHTGAIQMVELVPPATPVITATSTATSTKPARR